MTTRSDACSAECSTSKASHRLSLLPPSASCSWWHCPPQRWPQVSGWYPHGITGWISVCCDDTAARKPWPHTQYLPQASSPPALRGDPSCLPSQEEFLSSPPLPVPSPPSSYQHTDDSLDQMGCVPRKYAAEECNQALPNPPSHYGWLPNSNSDPYTWK